MDSLRIMKILNALPDQARREAMDFIQFLQDRYGKFKVTKSRGASRLGKEAFIGMWKNHDELKDSGEWIRKIRRNEWNN